MNSSTKVDIEVTNRCNAKCHFCPRDRTPHQGLMSDEVYEQALRRAVEYRALVAGSPYEAVSVSLCGLGEPMLNRRVVDFVQQARDNDFHVTMSSNGSLLDERRSAAILDAGLQQICINVGDEGEDYEAVYELPFQRTLDNVVRFSEMAEGRCEVTMVVVDHRGDPGHVDHMRRFWADHGIEQVTSYEVINRGGSLFVDHMQYERYPELAQARAMLSEAVGTPLCGAPFAYLFVGYDGKYYLCCSDWEKQAAMSDVFESSFLDVVGPKLAHLATREPVCRTCNLDPINRLTEELRGEAQGEIPAGSAKAMLDDMQAVNKRIEGVVKFFGHDVPAPTNGRRRIPVQSI